MMMAVSLTACEDDFTPISAEPEMAHIHLCPPENAPKQTACVPLHAEVKRTPQDMAQGMMFRTNLPEDHGMLFAFGQSQPRAFWMKNTLIPLDIAFFNNGTLHHVHPNATPHDETPIHSRGVANVVLETNGGWFQRHGVTVGWRLVQEE